LDITACFEAGSPRAKTPGRLDVLLARCPPGNGVAPVRLMGVAEGLGAAGLICTFARTGDTARTTRSFGSRARPFGKPWPPCGKFTEPALIEPPSPKTGTGAVAPGALNTGIADAGADAGGEPAECTNLSGGA